jgi:hypothetical protein
VYSVRGDILELSPLLSEVCALWIRGGFNERLVTWNRIKAWLGDGHDRPWNTPNDCLLPLEPPKGVLRWLLIFSNPKNAMAFGSLDMVNDAVMRTLDQVVSLHAQSISFIHIPSVHNHSTPRDMSNLESATTMVRAVQRWSEAHPEHDLNVYLVDHDGDFERVPGLATLDLAFRVAAD